jgi:hypothetical protein
MRRIIHLGILLMALTGAAPTVAETLPAPDGPVLLTVSGRISHTNRDGDAVFDRAMLEDLGLTTLATSTPWTDGVPLFEGVPMAALLDAVGAEGEVVRGIALNAFEVALPLGELRRYPVLLALSMDGERLSVRDKGPLWIVYPRDQYAELQAPFHNQKWIWQLHSLIVE